MKNKVYIIGGGTYEPISNHFGLASTAKGNTARELRKLFLGTKLQPELRLSKIAHESNNGETYHFNTSNDLQNLIDEIKADNSTKMIILNAAVCDYKDPAGRFDKQRPSEETVNLELTRVNKILKSIRDKAHKHIFLVSFKNTTGATQQEMYLAGLAQCKTTSSNLVFVNDYVTKKNMIVTPEESAYADGWEREDALKELVDISILRSHLSFTKSTVIDGKAINWNDKAVPASLKTIVDYCIKENAYKVFNGSTVGHFACKVAPTTFLTSIRRSNFNDLDTVGLVKVETDGEDSVYAYGQKPSVGGQSQRIIFDEHKDMDCVVHFHCPLKENPKNDIPTRSQREVECGSHECGATTSSNLKQFGNLKAVYLDHHGPNIVFNKDIDPQEVIQFIKNNFSLAEKTGGYNFK